MVEYLKEYGSYQQQKLAIAEEYAQKIADVEASEADEATKQWQKKKLNNERLQKEASLSFENISRGIDWHALFSGVGDLTKEMMSPKCRCGDPAEGDGTDSGDAQVCRYRPECDMGES